VNVESLKSFVAGQTKIDPAQIPSALAIIPQWQCHDQVISRTYEFKKFPAAMDFVNAIGRIAEQVQHHPDIDIRWNKVTLALTTHDAGGLTEKDFALARQCDELSLR
jgi:4a-hydroxytetrahydrobiopterin dehydratase